MKQDTTEKAAQIIHQGGIIAYPTEAVFGLGCDPFNQSAVTRLLTLKQRSSAKGLILLASNWQQLLPLITMPNEKLWTKIRATWPGAVTWLFPASSQVPDWIKGNHDTVAIRLTAHPIAQALCNAVGHVIVSTSANKTAQTPLCSAATVKKLFGYELDYILPGAVGNLTRPTPIRDAISGETLRE